MSWRPDPMKIAGDRINAGEPVNERYLYGNKADYLLKNGTVTLHQIDQYRRCQLDVDEKLYGENEAKKKMQERHTKYA